MEAQTHVHIWTQVLRVWSESVPLPSASEVDGGAEWSDQTSTTSKLVEQLHSSLTEAAEEDVEEYRPVLRYHSPDDWGQVTSPVSEPPVWTLNGEWNEAASAQRNMLTLSSWRGNSSTCLIPRYRTTADGVTKRSLWQLVKSTTCSWPEDVSLGCI